MIVPTLSAGPATSLRSVDDFLGPAEHRFFGEGFTRVRHALTRVEVSPAEGTVTALASVAFPAHWSTKAQAAQRPHLSTIDVLVVAARLSEALAVELNGLWDGAPVSLRLLSADIRAGKAPLEDGLELFAVSGTLLRSYDAAVPGQTISVVQTSVATMSVTCQVQHPSGAEGGAFHRSPSAGAARTWMPELQDQQGIRRAIESVALGADGLSAAAILTVQAEDRPPGQDVAGAGPGDSVSPQVCLVGLFVTGLQLGQVLLYRLDEMDRATSNTLWMRRTVLTAGTPTRAANGVPVRTTLREPRLLPALGRSWRAAEIRTTLGDWTMSCSVAHALPERQSPDLLPESGVVR